MLKLIRIVSIATLGAASFTALHAQEYAVPSPRTVQPRPEPPADVCVATAHLDALAAPGDLRWRITLTNTRTAACTMTAVDFPASVPGGRDGPGVHPTPTSESFEPDLKALSVRGGAGACALAAVPGQAGSSLHCANLVLPASASVSIDVWTAGLVAPPMRYCLTGYANAATTAWPQDPQLLAACADVYQDAIAPSDVVVEGPIVVSTEGAASHIAWIGGNYTGHDLTSFSVQVPTGGFSVQGLSGAWRCVKGSDTSQLTCTTPFLAAGASLYIEAVAEAR